MDVRPEESTTRMRLVVAFVVVTLSGYIALSYEIIWLRAYLFLTEGAPNALGLFLGAYLSGLAGGALIARCGCRQQWRHGLDHPLCLSGLFLLFANVAGFIVIPAMAHLVSFRAWPPGQTLPIVAVVAACLGTSLPLVSHFGISPNSQAGFNLSCLYVGNILGSVAGSLITGFILLDVLSLPKVILGLTLLGILCSGTLILAASAAGRRFVIASGLAVVVIYVFWLSPMLYDSVYEKLLYKEAYFPGLQFAHIYENKSGIVTVSKSGTVYGGGAYDGQFNTNPLPGKDINRVVRAYAVVGCPRTPFFGQILCPVFGPGYILLECPRLLSFGLGRRSKSGKADGLFWTA